MDNWNANHFESEINQTMKDGVDYMEAEVARIRATDAADEAEKRLDSVINDCIHMYSTKMGDVRESIRRRRPINPQSPTYNQDLEHWKQFSDVAVTGISRTQTVFEQVLSRVREIVSNILQWIANGMTWGLELLRDAFDSIRRVIS
ncbi:hypothetical protein I4U23_004602 [Adineta vaga]|nr:hypothetical protein I4U23_004602 [Adineta vaga]